VYTIFPFSAFTARLLRSTKLFSSNDQRKLPRILDVPLSELRTTARFLSGSDPGSSAAVEFIGFGVNSA